MRIRKLAAVLVALATLAGGYAGVAVAGTGPGGGGPPAAADRGQRCERLQHVLEKAHAKLERVNGRIAKLQERLAGADLTPEQQARLERKLTTAGHRLAKVQRKIAKIEGRIERKCSDEPAGEAAA